MNDKSLNDYDRGRAAEIYLEIIEFTKKYEGEDSLIIATVLGNMLLMIARQMKISPKNFAKSMKELTERYKVLINECQSS